MPANRRTTLACLAAVLSAGCATLPGREPLKVSLAGVESLGGQGLEMRFAVKLRVQNPNEQPVDYDGVSLDLAVRGHAFASGVSDARGSIGRFGEAVLTVPVSVPATAVLMQVVDLVRGTGGSRVEFVARGRLAGGWLGGTRFESSGEFDWPGAR